MNFLVTATAIDRPKRVRWIAGSRGMSYGYPPKDQWKKYEQLTSGLLIEAEATNKGLTTELLCPRD
jgi:hypothetical protein